MSETPLPHQLREEEDPFWSVIAAYLEAVEDGREAPAIEDLCRAHPDLADRIREFFGDQAAVLPLLTPFRQVVALQDGLPIESFGDYELESRVGMGGMGEVILARDRRLNRKLAIKVPRRHYWANPRVVKRFVEEAQILSQLQGPGFVPVYDLGTYMGLCPYYTMKFVQGPTLADELLTRTSATDDLPRFLEIFRTVCEAVAYAHDRGVLHRDLKPANVMIEKPSNVYVMDWGLGKADSNSPEEDSGQTEYVQTDRSHQPQYQSQAGDVFGTFAYMPPEQAQGDVDGIGKATDVFSLGAILCELLTGSPPYAGSREEILDQARRGSLQRAFDTLTACGAEAELVSLTKKCLAPRKEDRPASAAEVAAAVAKYQTDAQEAKRRAELENARTKVKLEEEQKRVAIERQKRRVTVGLLFAIILILVAGGAVGYWFLTQRAEKARMKALAEQNISTVIGKARGYLDELHAELGRPGGVFRMLDEPQRWRGYINSARETAEGGAKIQTTTTSAIDPSLAQELTRLNETIRRAEDDYQLALQLEAFREQFVDSMGEQSKQTITNFSKLVKQYDECFTHNGLSPKANSRDRITESVLSSPIKERLLAAYDEWMILRMFVHGRDDTLAREILELTRTLDDNPIHQEIRTRLMTDDDAGIEALAARGPSVDISPIMLFTVAAALLDKDREIARSWTEKAILLHPDDFWLNVVLNGALPPEESALKTRFVQAALAIRPGSCIAWNNYAMMLREQKRLKECLYALEEAVRIDPQRAVLWNNLATTLGELREFNRAEEACRKALELDSELASAWTNLGHLLAYKKDLEGAVEACRKGLELDPDSMEAWNNYGRALFLKKDYNGARDAFLEALKRDPKSAVGWCNIAEVARQLKDLKAANFACQQAIKHGPQLAAAWNNLGMVRLEEKKQKEAAEAFRKAIELDPQFAMAWANLGEILRTEGKTKDAEEACRRALEITPELAAGWNTLGLVQLQKKDTKAALSSFRKAVELDPQHPMIWSNLGTVLLLEKEWKEAEAACRKAVALDVLLGPGWLNLGKALAAQDQYSEAITSLQTAIYLIPDSDPNSSTAEKELRQLLERLLPRVLGGEELDCRAKLTLADYCLGIARRARDALSLYRSAFKTGEDIGSELRAHYHYNAACAAVLAASEKSSEAPEPPEAERRALRDEAFRWLKGIITEKSTQLNGGNPDLKAIDRELKHWQTDPDLSEVRDEARLARFTEQERNAWKQLWSDVDRLRKQVQK